jgi:hypothetical protein
MNNELESLWDGSVVALFDIKSLFMWEIVLYHWVIGARCVGAACWPRLLRVH